MNTLKSIRVVTGVTSVLMTSIAMATSSTTPPQNIMPMTSGVYIGAFGGWGSSNDFNVNQSGVAFFTQPPLNTPLPVDANGDVDDLKIGFGGLHIGYEWVRPLYKDMTWTLTPAVEVEGLYFKKTAQTDVVNPNPRLGAHTFDDSFPMKTGVVLVNSVFSIKYMNSRLSPYVGFGLGAARISISDADSLQINPSEPNVNHFNSDTGSADWTFAAQGKIGLRFAINEHLRVFAEYRLLYVGNTDYTFGSTNYPTHVETTSWVVNMDNTHYNTGTLGIDWTL